MIVPKVCPQCGCEIHPRIWMEDGYIVEYVFRCLCGYGEHWSYGAYFDMEDY